MHNLDFVPLTNVKSFSKFVPMESREALYNTKTGKVCTIQRHYAPANMTS